MEKPNYYGLLPADVRYDKNLKPAEKILYSELTALANVKGYCYANNSYFAQLYEVHKKTVCGWISHLAELGYIKVELILKEGSNEVEERRIYIVTERKIVEESDDVEQLELFEEKNTPTLSVKTGGGYPSKDTYPIREKTEDNNINIILQDEYYKGNIKEKNIKKEKRDKKVVFNSLEEFLDYSPDDIEEKPELFSAEELFGIKKI